MIKRTLSALFAVIFMTLMTLPLFPARAQLSYCHGDLDFRIDTVNGAASQNYLTCDYLDLAKFREYYFRDSWMPEMSYADYNCDNAIGYLDLARFRQYYMYYPLWTLCEGPCHWHWPPPPY